MANNKNILQTDTLKAELQNNGFEIIEGEKGNFSGNGPWKINTNKNIYIITTDGEISANANIIKVISSSETKKENVTDYTNIFTWEELSAIANKISNDTGHNITSDTSQVSIKFNGIDYVIGIGDTMNVKVNKVTFQTLILGFNHDTLVEDETKKAGISFQFATDLTYHAMNTSNINEGGWGACEMKTFLNEYLEKFENKNFIKTVKKDYIKQINSASTNTERYSIHVSNDKLWLLSVGEIFGKKEHAYEMEGKIYKYYANGGSTFKYNHSDNSQTILYWLRSPKYNNATQYCAIRNSDGGCGYYVSSARYDVVPGFSI